MPFRAADIVHQCQHCGKWTIGPFAGRSDVSRDELSAYFERITGRPAAGEMEPAPRGPGMVYGEGSREPEPYSGGICGDCLESWTAAGRARRERMRAALAAPEPEPPLSATGSSDDDAGGTPT